MPDEREITKTEASEWKDDSQEKKSECEVISGITTNVLCSYLHFYVCMVVIHVFSNLSK